MALTKRRQSRGVRKSRRVKTSKKSRRSGKGRKSRRRVRNGRRMKGGGGVKSKVEALIYGVGCEQGSPDEMSLSCDVHNRSMSGNNYRIDQLEDMLPDLEKECKERITPQIETYLKGYYCEPNKDENNPISCNVYKNQNQYSVENLNLMLPDLKSEYEKRTKNVKPSNKTSGKTYR